ncbi:hypothetical protein ACQCM2_005224 [Escherichia coli]|nr:hypothetical protein [Escherichia coli]
MDKYQIWEKQKDTIAHKEYLKISDTNLLGHIHIANYEVIQSELSKFNSPEIVFHYSLNRNELKKRAHKYIKTFSQLYLLSIII